ncbi:MAG TPA: tetratricopeptide repeat protein, partial [Candidatus Eisenbacteria bacterium]|nr:tetratricopeptide repeat protein [Candidatus Eisenbacteria bacterium]
MNALPEAWPEVSADILELFESDAAQHPTWADVQNRWGLALLAGGRFVEARVAFERALERNPRYGWAAMNHLQTLALLGDTDAARVRLADAPWPAEGCREFAHAFLALCEGQPLPEAWAPLPEQFSHRPDFLRLRAAVLRERDPQAASAAWDEAAPWFAAPIPGWVHPLSPTVELPYTFLGFIPGLYQLMKELSTWEARLARSDRAVSFAHAMTVFWYDLGAAWCQRGFLANLAGEETDALLAYQRAAAEAPTSPEPWIALAYLWSAQGSLEQADEALRQSLDRAPGYAD